MRILVTGGAGFIGRWVVKSLLEQRHHVWVLDNLSNGQRGNLREFENNPHFKFIPGDVRNKKLISKIFKNKFDVCIHAAAAIEVQDSIDNPENTFDVNVNGTLNILEEARRYNTKTVLVGTCMVYDMTTKRAINEKHPAKSTSPYASSKLAAENIAESYHHCYGLPVVILRPFNVYGPYQKSNMEGGVVSIFIKKHLEGKPLIVYGDGNQTRDFMYVEDCADFIVKAAFSEDAVGEIINAGLGKDITINRLASLICKDPNRIKHVKHHHPQSEITKLLCDHSKAKRLLGWEPKVNLEEGIKRTKEWLKNGH